MKRPTTTSKIDGGRPARFAWPFLLVSAALHLPILLGVALLTAPVSLESVAWIETIERGSPAESHPSPGTLTGPVEMETAAPDLAPRGEDPEALLPSAFSMRLAERMNAGTVSGTQERRWPKASATKTPTESSAPTDEAIVEIPEAVAPFVAAALAGLERDAEVAEPTIGGAGRDRTDVIFKALSVRHVDITVEPEIDRAILERRALLAQSFTDYYSYLRAKIHPLWHFPKRLELLGEEGTVIIAFVIHRDGGISNVHVTKRSGFKEFDDNVLAAVRLAAPFKPIPSAIGKERIALEVPFDFDNPVVRWTP